jgi:hypothetical protein
MFIKTNRWIFVFLAALYILLLAIVWVPDNASAAPSVSTASNTCLTCHEDLYYNHDTGCWYCITAHKGRCAGCHEGNPTAVKAEEAHLGMILHPQENNGEKCLDCHTADDAQMRLVDFKATVGFDTVLRPEAYTPSETTVLGFPEIAEPSPLKNWPWLAGGIVLFGFWLVLVLMSPQKP